jgi:parallel beta-helix repeat protein
MTRMRRLAVAVAALAVVAAPGRAAACRTFVAAGSIQAALDQAQPCDWVLVPPAIYREPIVVRTPSVHVRGLNRNTVVLDGGGIDVQADSVSIENLTVRNGGIRWSGVRGWRASYVTAYGGVRGLSAENGAEGSWDHVYASGFSDAGISCQACRATIAHAVAQRNSIGIASTGRVTVEDSLVRLNALGIRLGATGTVRRNRVEQNGQVGIEIAGTKGAVIANNIVSGNRVFGIVGHDALLVGNRITGNIVRGSRYDLALAGGADNCVRANRIRIALPADLRGSTCTAPDAADDETIVALLARLAAARRAPRVVLTPPPQPTMPHVRSGAPAQFSH